MLSEWIAYFLMMNIDISQLRGSHVCLELLQYIFESLQFNRAELRAVHQNIRSQKAIEKIGGVKEGVWRKHGYRNDGSIKHTVIFSIIDDEWPVTKEKLLQLIAESEND